MVFLRILESANYAGFAQTVTNLSCMVKLYYFPKGAIIVSVCVNSTRHHNHFLLAKDYYTIKVKYDIMVYTTNLIILTFY